MISKVVPSVKNELAGLPEIREVDALIRARISITDVARFIQERLGRMRDVPPDSMRTAISDRMAALKAQDESGRVHSATESPLTPRQPGVLAATLYSRVASGIDALVEIDALYLAQRDRLGWLIGLEAGDKVYNEKLNKEFRVAVGILETRADLQERLGLTGGSSKDSLEVSLKLKGVRTRHGATTAEVMANPESRQRVMTLAQQLIGLGASGALPPGEKPS